MGNNRAVGKGEGICLYLPGLHGVALGHWGLRYI